MQGTIAQDHQNVQSSALLQVIHDLQSPVAALKFYLLGQTDPKEGSQSNVRQANVKKAIVRLDQMLASTLAQVRQGHVSTHHSHISLQSAMHLSRQVLNNLRWKRLQRIHLQPLGKIQLKIVRKNNRKDYLNIDLNGLESIFENLIGNALSYSAKGSDVIIQVCSLVDRIEFKIQNVGQKSEMIQKGLGLRVVCDQVHRAKGKIVFQQSGHTVSITVMLPLVKG